MAVLKFTVLLGVPVFVFLSLGLGFLFVCEIALMRWGMKWPYALRFALRVWALLLFLGSVQSLGP